MKNKKILFCCLLVFGIAILACHAYYYYPFLSDDALISLRYADRLIDGKGLSWTDGRPVEGYSNLLWVLLNALLGFFGMDLVIASRLLGFACMVAIILTLLNWSAGNRHSQAGYLPTITGILFFCGAAPVAVWAIGGLEQPLYAALIALTVPVTVSVIDMRNAKNLKPIFLLSLVLGLLCITRPDGPLFSIAAFLSIQSGRLISRKPLLNIKKSMLLAAMPVLLYTAQLVFRLFYYGEWVPNTALVKISPSLEHITEGLIYTVKGVWALFPFSFFAILYCLAAIARSTQKALSITLTIPAVLWTLYIIFIGGDIFPAYRHFLPLIVIFSFANIAAATWFFDKLQNRFAKGGKLTGAIIVGLTFFLYFSNQFKAPENQMAIAERWEWDGKVIGLTLKNAFHDKRPLIAVTAAGCIPYWSGLPSLDMLGLNDYYLPRNPPDDFGKGYLGHELGNGQYVLESKPDIIIFHIGSPTPFFRSGRELIGTAAFHEKYSPVKVRGTDPHEYIATLWFSRYSEKIGIRPTSSGIYIPGYFLNGTDKAIAGLNEKGKLVMPLRYGHPLRVVIENAADSDWELNVQGPESSKLQTDIQKEGSTLVIRVALMRIGTVNIEALILTNKTAC